MSSANTGAGIPPPPPKPADNAGQTGNDNSIYKKYGAILKALSIAMGLVLIGLGIFNYAAVPIGDPINVILPFYYIIFGMLIIAAELSASYITAQFKFIENYIGRGLFYIFVGTLCMTGSSPF
jgi:hypothetical protein